MIDERTFELLSRYVDDDLTPEEKASLEEDLATSPELRETLESLQGNRRDLRSFARSEQPPDDLDRIVRPLRRAVRPMRRRWVVAGLAAAAAVLAVAVVLVEEVGRSDVLRPPPASTGADRGIFALSNPPAAPTDAPLGAVENLLARQDPPPELPPTEPELGIGPVDVPEEARAAVEAVVFDDTRLVLDGVCPGVEGTVVVTVSGGAVTKCRVEPSPDPIAESCLCAALEAVPDIGLESGTHRGSVETGSQ